MSLDRRVFETFIDTVRSGEREQAFDVLYKHGAEMNDLVARLVQLGAYLLSVHAGRDPHCEDGFIFLQPLEGSKMTLPLQVVVAAANHDTDMVAALTSTIATCEEANLFTYKLLRLVVELMEKTGPPAGWGVDDA